MSVDTANIPEKIYVTLKRQKGESENLLGFMSPYGKDTAFKKRQKTQLNWAYREAYPHSTYNQHRWWSAQQGQDQLMYIENKDEIDFAAWVEDESLPKIELAENYARSHTDRFITNCRLQVVDSTNELHPRILDNIPQTGFQFTKEVRRTYWGGGNVVWRILDPRGFELEISSSNLARIIDCSTIKEGVIEDPCVWGRSGAQNILLPISSAIYQEAQERTQQIGTSKKISLKDIQLGDKVKLLNPQRVDPTAEVEYLGKYTLIEAEIEYERASSVYVNYGINYAKTAVERYVFKQANGEMIFFGTPKIHTISTRIEHPRSKADIVHELNMYFSSNNIDGQNYGTRIVGCCVGAVKFINRLFSPIESDEVIDAFINKNHSLFAQYNGMTYMTVNHDTFGLKVVNIFFEDNSIKYVLEYTSGKSRYGYYNTKLPKLYDFNELKQLSWCNLVLDINGDRVPVSLKELNRIYLD